MGSTSQLVSCKDCDFLEQDPPIRGQKYVCLSFLSPEDALRNKEVYFFNKFVSQFAADMTEFFTNLGAKFESDVEVQDMLSNIRERYDYIFKADQLQSEYDFYKQSNSDTLEAEFYEKNEFRTSVRGIKVRGVYESIKEATMRADQLKRMDANFHVFVAEVGCWCPWSPNPDDIADQEFAETQLNTLMKKYKEGQEIKDELYRLRKDELVQKVKMHAEAIREENKMSGGVNVDVIEEAPNQEDAENANDAKDVENNNQVGDVAVMESEDPWLARKQPTAEDVPSTSA
jgi:hypothetical protein